MPTTVAEMQGILTLDDSQYKRGMTAAQGQTTSLGQGIQNAGMKMTRFGVGASLALAPVTLFLKSSVSAFRDFDVAMTNSQTILGATNEEMEILNAQVLEIGSNTGLGPQAVADAFFTVVSGVQDATTHMDILQNSVWLAEAGLADLAVTTDGMVAIMNAYRFAAEDAGFVSDVFTRTVQMGVGTMDEFVAALSPLGSLANTLGISFEELAGAEALMTAQGVSASAAATRLQGVMTAFIKPNTDMTAALAEMGFESGQVAIETLGLQGAVDALSSALNDDVGAMASALGRTEALNGALVLAGEGAEEFLDSFSSGVDGATDAARALQNATDAAISDAFTAKVDTLKILIGEGLSGAMADAQAALLPIIDSIMTWAQENPNTVETIVALIGAASGLAAGLVVVGGVVTVLGVAIGLLTSPIFLVIAAGAALAAAYMTNFGGLKDFIDGTVLPAIQSLVDSLLGVWEQVAPALEPLRAWFMDSIMPAIIDFVNTAFIPMIEFLVETFVMLWDAVSPALTSLADWFLVTGLPLIADFITGPVTDAFTAWLGFLVSIWTLVEPALTAFRDGAVEIFGFIITNAIDPITWAIEQLIGIFGDVLSGAADVLNVAGDVAGAVGNITGTISGGVSAGLGVLGFAGGGDFNAMQEINVGEDGPETVTFPAAGTVTPNNRQSDGPMVDTVNIYASTYEGGREAARGFNEEMIELRREQG